VDVSLFKSHSLRGASATAMLAAGVPQNVTRQRGGWADDRAFEKHYARLHQVVDWEAALHIHQPLFLSEYTVPPDRAQGSTSLGDPEVVEMATSFSAEPLVAKSPGGPTCHQGT
jgi:hypothetical protein